MSLSLVIVIGVGVAVVAMLHVDPIIVFAYTIWQVCLYARIDTQSTLGTVTRNVY